MQIISFVRYFEDSPRIDLFLHFSRNYRGDVDNSVIEKFIGLVNEREEEGRYVAISSVLSTKIRFFQSKGEYTCQILGHLEAT